MSNLRKMQEQDYRLFATAYNDQFLFTLISEYIHQLSQARQREAEDKSKILELNELLTFLNKVLRHDILNDLTILKVNLELYLRSHRPEALSIVNQAFARGVKKINKIGELERALSTGASLKPYSLLPVIKEVVKGFPELRIKVNGEAEVLADEALYSVLENIFANAKIHGGAKCVNVRIVQKGKSIRVEIADDGQGIPEKIKSHLFREGFSFGQAGHTGLGLYIVRKTIERYGGAVQVSNRPKGAIFTLILPAKIP